MFLKSFWDDLKQGRNIDVYLALGLGIAASLVGVLGGSIEVIVAITSGTLALIAFSMVTNREQTSGVKESLLRLEEAVASIDRIVADRSDQEISEVINGANKELCFLVRMGNSLRSHNSEIEAALKRGCNVRLITCDEDDTTLHLLAYRGYSLDNIDALRGEMKQSMARLTTLSKRLAENPSWGKLTLHRIPYMPSIIIYIADADDMNAKVYAPLVTFRSSSIDAPGIKITRAQDQKLFEFLKNEFENYWKAATPAN